MSLFAACTGTPSATETSSATSTQSEVTASLTSPGTSTGQDPSASAPTTNGAIVCGNGVLEDSEVCDDGNSVDGDGCNNDCVESGTLLLEYRSGEAGGDAVYGLAVGPADEILVGGFRASGGSSRWLAGFSTELAPVFSQVFTGEGQESITSLVAVKDAIFAVGAVGQNNAHNIWVGRLTLKGALVWEDIVGESGEDFATHVVRTNEGDIVVSGLLQPDANSSLWLRRYSQDGNPSWTTTWPLDTGIKSYPLGPGLALTMDSVVIGFSAFKPGLTPEFLLEVPLSGGDPSWMLEIPETSGNILGLAAGTRGDILTTSTHLFENLMVRRITKGGDVSWASDKCVGKIGRGVTVDSSGDIIVIGDGPGMNGQNIRLCRLGPDGSLLWGKDIDGGVGDDLGYSVAIDSKNRIVAGGLMLVGENNRDAWVAVFSP